MQAWVCPKCGRVYNAMVFECKPCNRKVAAKEILTPPAIFRPGAYRGVVTRDGWQVGRIV